MKELECLSIPSAQEVQCVYMYSVAWDAIGIAPGPAGLAGLATAFAPDQKRMFYLLKFKAGQFTHTSRLGGGGV